MDDWEVQEWQSWLKPAIVGNRVEAKVQQWWDAKTAKNYDAADMIREELRAQGVNPDPKGSGKKGKDGKGGKGGKGSKGGKGGKGGWDDGWGGGGVLESIASIMQSPQAVPMLQQWKEAKENRDYNKADRLRDALRAQGINPDDMADLVGGGKGKGKFGPKKEIKNYAGNQSLDDLNSGQTELLTQWFDAKDQKNFALADTIRDRLRKDSIEPADCHRPGAIDNCGPEQIEDLRAWFDAKDNKNWGIADGLRDKLRYSGIEPTNCPRPGAGMDEEATELMNQWQNAMNEKNFGVADSLRTQLRAKGIEPAQASKTAKGGGKKRNFDPAMEAKLDEWDVAMKASNFGIADGLREELRAAGIEASKYRRK